MSRTVPGTATKRRPADPPGVDRLIRMRELQQMIGRSRSSIYRDERLGLFPRRRRIGPRSVAYLHSEVMAWIRSREGASK